MITMLDLEQLAEEMGVMIVTHTGGKKGGWNPTTRTVSLREGMHEVQTLCTLAHELGHAHYRHQLGATGLAREQQEREANEWAAILLIDENDYMAAEINCDSISSIAHELGVTILMVGIWRQLYAKGKIPQYCIQEAYSAAGEMGFGWWLVEHYLPYHVDCPNSCGLGESTGGR